jgi:hypothetical protein
MEEKNESLEEKLNGLESQLKGLESTYLKVQGAIELIKQLIAEEKPKKDK